MAQCTTASTGTVMRKDTVTGLGSVRPLLQRLKAERVSARDWESERGSHRLTRGCAVALVTEILLVSGVALDLVGAGVLSHAHNAESIVELREDIGEEGAAVGEPDALSTHAQLLAEKRIGFLLLTLGLVLYLSGVVLKSSEGPAMMGVIAGGVVLAGCVISVVFTRVVGNRIREQARRAMEQHDPDALPEQ